jgi:sterol desaturase/sphingolipid hydroxylase (fatty acid hydroxylase superfamily)
MFLYYLVFFMTYHVTGFITSYKDVIKSDLQYNVNTIKKYISGYKRVMLNTGVVSYVAIGVASSLIVPSDYAFVRHVEILKYMSCLFLMDFVRYFTHRLFHRPLFFERFHAINHQYISSPMWLVANTHWVDWICCYLLPCIVPLLVVSLHHFSVLFWIFSITLASVTRINEFRTLHYIFPDKFFSTGLVADRLFGSVA